MALLHGSHTPVQLVGVGISYIFLFPGHPEFWTLFQILCLRGLGCILLQLCDLGWAGNLALLIPRFVICKMGVLPTPERSWRDERRQQMQSARTLLAGGGHWVILPALPPKSSLHPDL